MANNSYPIRSAGLTAIAILISGCATVQKDAELTRIREVVSNRTGQQIEWSAQAYPAAKVREASAKLTENELTADAAVQLALLNNRRLQASLQRLGIAQADLVEAGLLENPVLTAGVLFQDAGREIEMDIVQSFIGIFTISARSKLGRLEADRVSLEVAADVAELAVRTKEQYYKVVGDTQALLLARKIVTGAEAAAEIAQRQYSAGNLSRREQAMQQSFYAEAALEVAQAEVQLSRDREALNRRMGLWGNGANWTVPERLPSVPRVMPSLSDLESLAVSSRLDLEAAKVKLEAIDQNLALAKQTRWLGALGIGVQFQRDAGGEKSFGPKVELGLPFFDRGQTRVARLESQRRAAEDSVTALAIEIRSEARESRDRLIAARDVARHYEKALIPIQNTIVSETLKFYNGMLLGVYDLLVASREQVRIGRQYIEANKEFWTALADLERAVGRRVLLEVTSEYQPTDPASTGKQAPAMEDKHHGEHES